MGALGNFCMAGPTHAALGKDGDGMIHQLATTCIRTEPCATTWFRGMVHNYIFLV